MNSSPKNPRISVLMSVYNGEEYLGEAIQSILDQTFKDFEFLIISEFGTNTKSLEIIESFKDKRIKHIKNNSRLGLPASLNVGIDVAKGDYIARMDTDDVSLPERFKEQVSYMDSHPDVGISGTSCKTIGFGKSFETSPLNDYEDIKANFLFYTSLAHPTVIIRKNLIDKYKLRYNPLLLHGEDYDIWVRCSEFFPITNINKVLLLYRVHNKNKGKVFNKETANTGHGVRMRLLNKLRLQPTEQEFISHNSTKPNEKQDLLSFIIGSEKWFLKIIEANKRTKIYKSKSLEKVIYQRWYLVCALNSTGGLVVWKKFLTSPLFKLGRNKIHVDCLKILIKCTISSLKL